RDTSLRRMIAESGALEDPRRLDERPDAERGERPPSRAAPGRDEQDEEGDDDRAPERDRGAGLQEDRRVHERERDERRERPRRVIAETLHVVVPPEERHDLGRDRDPEGGDEERRVGIVRSMKDGQPGADTQGGDDLERRTARERGVPVEERGEG